MKTDALRRKWRQIALLQNALCLAYENGDEKQLFRLSRRIDALQCACIRIETFQEKVSEQASLPVPLKGRLLPL